MSAAGLIEMPPVSKVTPLPTSATTRSAPSPLESHQPRRVARPLAHRDQTAHPHLAQLGEGVDGRLHARLGGDRACARRQPVRRRDVGGRVAEVACDGRAFGGRERGSALRPVDRGGVARRHQLQRAGRVTVVARLEGIEAVARKREPHLRAERRRGTAGLVVSRRRDREPRGALFLAELDRFAEPTFESPAIEVVGRSCAENGDEDAPASPTLIEGEMVNAIAVGLEACALELGRDRLGDPRGKCRVLDAIAGAESDDDEVGRQTVGRREDDAGGRAHRRSEVIGRRGTTIEAAPAFEAAAV